MAVPTNRADYLYLTYRRTNITMNLSATQTRSIQNYRIRLFPVFIVFAISVMFETTQTNSPHNF